MTNEFGTPRVIHDFHFLDELRIDSFLVLWHFNVIKAFQIQKENTQRLFYISFKMIYCSLFTTKPLRKHINLELHQRLANKILFRGYSERPHVTVLTTEGKKVFIETNKKRIYEIYYFLIKEWLCCLKPEPMSINHYRQNGLI